MEEKSVPESTVEYLKRKAVPQEVGERIVESIDEYEPVGKCARVETTSTVKPNDEDPSDQKDECDNGKIVSNEEKVVETESTDPDTEKDNTEPDKSKVIDPLGYTKAEEFTSEIFKIQVRNLPKFGFSQFKKRLISLGLKPHKFKSAKKEVTYVCFRNEADRQEAIKKITGHVWKGRTLDAAEAAPAADPFLQKKQEQRNQDKNSATTDSIVTAKQEPLTPEEAEKCLKDSVVPLWDMDYDKQLQSKTDNMRSVLKSLTRNHFVRDEFRQKESWKQDGMPCPLLPIVASPVTSEYRNKNEFTIGFTADGNTIKVGFRYGLYKDGTTTVGDSTRLGVLKPFAVPVVESFEKFVCQSQWQPYLQQTGTGHWHTLVLRTFDTGDVMAMAVFHPRNLSKNEIELAKNSIKEYYTNGEGKDVGIKSFYFKLTNGPAGVERLQHIFGEQYVYESLLDLKFRISPEAFFQVNTKATERLYQLIGEWCELSESSTVLDICCGTGTIGLSVAKRVKQVIGIEMCQSAVNDAIANAALNDISNTRYYCSKVEDVITKALDSIYIPSSYSSSSSASSSSASSSTSVVEELTTSTTPAVPGNESNIIAVVDPPRAGMHKRVIKTLRTTKDIKRLVYVSCNAQSAMENFVDLIRPCTGNHRGQPFCLEKAVPVDLFPGTRHCELVLLFTR